MYSLLNNGEFSIASHISLLEGIQLIHPNKNPTELGVNLSSQTSTLSKPSDKAKHLEPKCHKLLGTLHQWLPMLRLWLDNLPVDGSELRDSLTSDDMVVEIPLFIGFL